MKYEIPPEICCVSSEPLIFPLRLLPSVDENKPGNHVTMQTDDRDDNGVIFIYYTR